KDIVVADGRRSVLQFLSFGETKQRNTNPHSVRIGRVRHCRVSPPQFPEESIKQVSRAVSPRGPHRNNGVATNGAIGCRETSARSLRLCERARGTPFPTQATCTSSRDRVRPQPSGARGRLLSGGALQLVWACFPMAGISGRSWNIARGETVHFP